MKICVISFMFLSFIVSLSFADELTFSGEWETNWGVMSLRQAGNTISGTYTHDQGKIQAKLIGNVLSGKWSEYPTYRESADAGDVQLVLSADGQSFTGKWRYGSSGEWRKDWTGKRIKTYWEEERPGKKDKCDAEAVSWQCKEVVFDGKQVFIDLAGTAVPAGSAVTKVGKTCVSIAAKEGSEASGILVHRASQCNCRINVNWTCKYKKKLCSEASDEVIREEDDYYSYKEKRDERGFTECTPGEQATCEEFCKRLATNFPSEYAKDSASSVRGKTVAAPTVFIPGWKNKECEE